jgi:hypothetical protein
VLHYLLTQHFDAWRDSPQDIRELLESPNIYVLLMAIDILDHDDASPHVLENLRVLRAILLNRMQRRTKRKVLRVLERAAQSNQHAAQAIMPMLEMIIRFRGKRAITEDVMVAFVRLKDQMDQSDQVEGA